MESGSSEISAGSSMDFGFAFNDAKFSDRSLRIEIMPCSKPDNVIDSLADWALSRKRMSICCDQDSEVHEVVQSIGSTDYLAKQVKTIHISTMLLAAKSPFFYKLFSNGMLESNEQHVTLQIPESEEVAFMDLLKFMYTNTLSSTTPPALLDVLMVADKYEVVSCMKYCFRLLHKLPMTCETALLYLDLLSTPLIANTVEPLIDVAKQFLVARFNDISKFQEEMLDLPLSGIEAVLSRDDLQVSSEDEIYDFVMKWARRHYPKPDERQEILVTRLLNLIRFPFMSCSKLKEVLTCTDINLEHRSKLVFDAISLETPHRQLPLVKEPERAYKLRPVKVIRFDSPCEGCVVYLDLKREECTSLIPCGEIWSRPFDLGGQAFHLIAVHDKTKQPSFGFFVSKQKKGSLRIEIQFASRKKPSEEFECDNYKLHHKFVGATDYGFRNLFNVSWDTFIAEDSPYFINGVVHLRVELKIQEECLYFIAN